MRAEFGPAIARSRQTCSNSTAIRCFRTDNALPVSPTEPVADSGLSFTLKSMRIKARYLFPILLLVNLAPASAGVLFNEIMYHPNSTNVLEEWFELYNPGPTNVSLSGWQISNGLLSSFTIPTNTTIFAGGFLVVAADAATFASKYPGVTNVVSGSAGPLQGHTLALDDNTGKNINSVNYYPDGDWATLTLTTNGFAAYRSEER